MRVFLSLWKYFVFLLVSLVILWGVKQLFGASDADCIIGTCGSLITGIVPPLIKYFGYAVLAVLITPILTVVAKPIMGEIISACTPTAKESLRVLLEDVRSAIQSLKASIDRGDLNVVVKSEPIFGDDELKSLLELERRAQETALKEKRISEEVDNHLAQAKQLVEDGDYLKGIELYKKILETNQEREIYELLLSAYAEVLDKDVAANFDREAFLKDAEDMLCDYGEPIHYVTIAYNYWENEDLQSALRVAEAGYQKYHGLNDGDEESYKAVLGIQNSLAYYLADIAYHQEAVDEDQKERAFELIGSALSYWKERVAKANEDKRLALKSYANFLDTQGFLNIVFGDTQDQVDGGYAQCKEAHNRGIEEELYARHTRAYHKKLGEFLRDK